MEGRNRPNCFLIIYHTKLYLQLIMDTFPFVNITNNTIMCQQVATSISYHGIKEVMKTKKGCATVLEDFTRGPCFI